jgi:translation initiation factor 3 subunit F
VPYEIRYGEAEKSGLEIISSARDREDRTAGVVTDIEGLERAIEETIGLLDRVAKYVEAVIEEEAEPSTALGQFLLNTLALAPKVDAADIERDL